MLPLHVRFLGYYRVSVEEKYKTRLQNLLFVARITAYPDTKGGYFIQRKDKERLLSFAKRERLSLTVSELLGLSHRLRENRHRIGLPVGLLLAAFLLFLGTHTVWRVEVSGNENISSREVIEGLSSLGFGIGSPTEEENYDGVITEYRLAHPEIAWMGIYTQGTTAYVRVIENKTQDETENIRTPSHLVASKDALILRLDIAHGTPTVKPGNVVKKGDVLALGIVSGAHYDTILAAEGAVIGRVSESFSVEIPYRQTEKIEIDRKILAFDLNFFQNTINIFKKTSKNPLDYVIIERKEDVTLPSGRSLPIGVTVHEAIYYEETERILEKADAIFEGTALLDEMIRRAVGNGAILSRNVRIEEKEDSCVLYATVEYTENIAERLPFTVG